jgi:uncharacterized damage-inducible protein DinB
MITGAYVRTMAAYNAEMNRRIYSAASLLPDAVRKLDRGAYWGSLHGTLNHLLWGDLKWMSRFDGWERPAVPLVESGALYDDFGDLYAERAGVDRRITYWADFVTEEWLGGEIEWFSGAVRRPIRAPTALLVMHFFNHQAHHRGQAHALLCADGADSGVTDLFLVLPAPLSGVQA